MASAQGKTVLVTGAAGGLGKVIAETFLSAGANVVICDVNQQRISAVEEDWTKTYADRFLTKQTDVSNEAAVQELIDASVAKFGRLDVLVNNAAIMDDFSPAGDCSKELWDRVLAINLTGPFLTTKAAVKQFEKQEQPGGVIVNIGSNAGYMGFEAGVAYTASKHAVMALTKNTAGFYADKGIYCMSLLLGGLAGTNIVDSFAKGMHVEMYQKVMASGSPFEPGKNDTPLESIAKYCLFLSQSDIAPVSNGSCVVFNRNWPVA
ncbi:hypothetical protein QBC45DRAFT_238669 [Copromyces sp. CBS 386.78]|nr:hypothetical protein QBC45DRAFT_238669 [Copromyces sp. CBS 386.78]